MTELERLLAYEEIRQLVSRYALFLDSRDLDSLAALFVPDVQVGRERFGRAALRDDFAQQLRPLGPTILFVGNHVIDFEDDDRARGVVYCRAEIAVGERWIRQAIQYRDRYECRAGIWLFARRVHLLWYGVAEGTNPLAQPAANWPESHTGRGTLPESWDSWQTFERSRGGEGDD